MTFAIGNSFIILCVYFTDCQRRILEALSLLVIGCLDYHWAALLYLLNSRGTDWSLLLSPALELDSSGQRSCTSLLSHAGRTIGGMPNSRKHLKLQHWIDYHLNGVTESLISKCFIRFFFTLTVGWLESDELLLEFQKWLQKFTSKNATIRTPNDDMNPVGAE